MDPNYPPKKQGLSGLAWLGIGCGGVVVLMVIIGVLIGLFFGTKIKEMVPRVGQFVEMGQQNPPRTAATIMITAGKGVFEMAAEDDANKRYTVRDKNSGNLFTFYWDAKTGTVKTVKGDFSAIPSDASTPH